MYVLAFLFLSRRKAIQILSQERKTRRLIWQMILPVSWLIREKSWKKLQKVTKREKKKIDIVSESSKVVMNPLFPSHQLLAEAVYHPSYIICSTYIVSTPSYLSTDPSISHNLSLRSYTFSRRFPFILKEHYIPFTSVSLPQPSSFPAHHANSSFYHLNHQQGSSSSHTNFSGKRLA